MKEIHLTRGYITKVDDEDYEWLSKWNWYAKWNGPTKSFYAARTINKGMQKETVLMARVILKLDDSKVVADHKNGDTLDNQKDNLRVATYSQNNSNSRIRKDNTSGFKGVYWKSSLSKWGTAIMVDGKNKHLGYFNLKEEAFKAYCDAAQKYKGEFARMI